MSNAQSSQEYFIQLNIYIYFLYYQEENVSSLPTRKWGKDTRQGKSSHPKHIPPSNPSTKSSTTAGWMKRWKWRAEEPEFCSRISLPTLHTSPSHPNKNWSNCTKADSLPQGVVVLVTGLELCSLTPHWNALGKNINQTCHGYLH